MSDEQSGKYPLGELESDQDDLVGRLVRVGARKTDLPDDRFERIGDAVYASWQSSVKSESARRMRQKLSVGMGVAATLVLALYVSTFPQSVVDPSTIVAEVLVVQGRVAHTDGREELSPGSFVHPGQRIETSQKSGLSLALGQGRSLRIGQSSILGVHGPNDFELVEGVLYYDSYHPKVGIRIRTYRGIVRDIGTQFEVRSSAGRLGIRVREGEVEFDDNSWFTRSEGVSVGEELVIEEQGTSRKKIVVSGDDWLWIQSLSPTYDLENRTLDEALSWIARERGWKLRYSNGQLQDEARKFVLHGVALELSQTDALELITEISSLEYVLEGGELTIFE